MFVLNMLWTPTVDSSQWSNDYRISPQPRALSITFMNATYSSIRFSRFSLMQYPGGCFEINIRPCGDTWLIVLRQV